MVDTTPAVDKDAALIKANFDEPILKSIRALFLGLETTPPERVAIKAIFANKELLALMWKRFVPVIDRHAPIGQMQDVWLGAEQMIFGQPVATIEQAVKYKERAIDMTRQALRLLENPDGQAPEINHWGNIAIDPLQVELQARNMFIRHVEQQLGYLLLIANAQDEKPEETKKRQAKDSTQ